MRTVKIQNYNIYAGSISDVVINDQKKVVNTINAHSYIVAKQDETFREALEKSDVLLPDGEGIVLMTKLVKQESIKKIAGADIHNELLNRAQEKGLKCFYLGSSETTLNLIEEKLSKQYDRIEFEFLSPPFKESFSQSDNQKITEKINIFKPDVLFVGMTAPKQEKWVFENKDDIEAKIICSIGAVFDFIAETKKRAPDWVIKLKLEWLYRSFTAWRLTKRYAYSTPLFFKEILKMKFFKQS